MKWINELFEWRGTDCSPHSNNSIFLPFLKQTPKPQIDETTSALILIAHDIIIHISRRAVASISIPHDKTGVVAFAHTKHRNIETTYPLPSLRVPYYTNYTHDSWSVCRSLCGIGDNPRNSRKDWTRCWTGTRSPDNWALPREYRQHGRNEYSCKNYHHRFWQLARHLLVRYDEWLTS